MESGAEGMPRDLFHLGLAEQPLLPEDAVQALRV